METLDGYLDGLASTDATPGGGSAATIVAACGAALAAMVGRICAASPKYAPYAELLDRVVHGADELRASLAVARARDERAFAAVVAAQALPKDDDARKAARAAAIERALHAAAEEPLHAAALALRVLRLAAELTAVPNKNLTSDVGCAGEFAHAAVRACAYNVRINHRFMHDAAVIADQAQKLAGYESEAAELLTAIRACC